MAIQWSGWYNTAGSQRWRIGIEYATSGTTVWYNVWVQALYSVFDSIDVHHNVGSVSYYLDSTAERMVTPASPQPQFATSRGQGVTLTAYIDRNSIYSGGRPYENPTVSVSFVTPTTVPDAPGQENPTEVTSSSFRMNGAVPYNGGSAITEWRFQVSTDYGFSNIVKNYHHAGGLLHATGLWRATTYYVRIAAWNANGWSAWSHIRSATTLSRAPGAPAAPTVSGVSSTRAALSFGAVADNGGSAVTSRHYQTSRNNTFTDLVYDTQSTSATRSLSGLTAATTYYSRNRAYNVNGWSAWSAVTQFATKSTIPAAPSTPSIISSTQTSVSASWGAPYSGGSPITGYEIQASASNSFDTIAASASASSQSCVISPLNPGTTYYIRVRAVNSVGPGPWSPTATAATISGTPLIVPLENLSANRISGVHGFGVQIRGWTGPTTVAMQISTSSSFDSIVKTFSSTLNGNGADQVIRLFDPALVADGTYYARAQVTNNTSGYVSDWSDTASYTVRHAPSVVPNSPKGNIFVQYQSSIPISFVTYDSGLGDTIKGYEVVIENNSTGALLDSGIKNISPLSPGLVSYGYQMPVELKGAQLRWKVRVVDSIGQWSPFTGYSIFAAHDLPVVTITSPSGTAAVESGDPEFAWAVTIPSGGTQREAVATVYDQVTNRKVWERLVAGQVFTARPSSIVLENGRTYRVEIFSTDTNGLVGTVVKTFTVSYVSPAPVPYTVTAEDSHLREFGYVLVDWSGLVPDTTLDSFGIYRKAVGESDWTLIAEIRDAGARQYRDWSALGGMEYMYSVTQRASRSGTVLESPVGFTIVGGQQVPDDNTYPIKLSNYWLIVDGDDGAAFRINIVKGDSFSEEYESETINVIGRGRHRDYGTRFGYSGTLSIQLMGTDARRDRLDLHRIRLLQDRYWLKTPFGDMFPVALGDMSIDRISGTGDVEMTNISVAYEEVF